MDHWKPLNGRITLFPVRPSDALAKSALDLYMKVWGSQPSSFNSGQNALQPSVAQGQFGGMVVSCLTQQNRIDFQLNPGDSMGTSSISPDVAVINDADEYRAALQRVAAAFDADAFSTKFNRLACATQYVLPTKSVAECNDALVRVIPEEYRPNLTDQEDFVLQLNQPAESSVVEKLRLNRLSIWSAQKLQVLLIEAPTGMPPGQMSFAGIPHMRATHLTASVSLEVNNAAVENGLSAQSAGGLLREYFTAIAKYREELGIDIDAH